MPSFYGYIPQTGRALDPGITGQDCFICHMPLQYRDMCMLELGQVSDRAYFCRVHETCWEALSLDDKETYRSVACWAIDLDLATWYRLTREGRKKKVTKLT